MCYAFSEISNFFWEENPANICCKTRSQIQVQTSEE